MSAKTAHKITAATLYFVFIFIAVWGGVRLINNSLDIKFYKDYLLQWEVALKKYVSQDGSWPEFTKTNHVEYMNNIIKLLDQRSIRYPLSNTECAYVYQIDKISLFQKKRNIFLLCFNNKIILYGVTPKTFKTVDTFIDGRLNLYQGRFTGKQEKDGKTLTGVWRL